MRLPCKIFLPLVLVACASQHAGISVNTASADQVKQAELGLERAQVNHDSVYLKGATASTLRFTHGTGRVENQREWISGTVKNKYFERTIQVDSVELHGDVAVSTGNVHVRRDIPDASRADYTIWYVRVYKRISGQWILLSHKTVKSTLPPR